MASICGLCRRGKEVENECGLLWVAKDCIAHHKCMQYSALLVQYKFNSFGGFKIDKVAEEIKRGKRLKCSACKSGKNGKKWTKITGATCGCAIAKCPKTYHYFCAKKDPKVITRRLEKEQFDNNKKIILYRVFCSEKHQDLYRANEVDKYISDSDDNDDEDNESSDDTSDEALQDDEEYVKDDSERTVCSQMSQNSPTVKIAQLSQNNTTPEKFEFNNASSRSKEKNRSSDASCSLEDLFLHLTQDTSEDSGSDSDSDSNGTSAGDLKKSDDEDTQYKLTPSSPNLSSIKNVSVLLENIEDCFDKGNSSDKILGTVTELNESESQSLLPKITRVLRKSEQELEDEPPAKRTCVAPSLIDLNVSDLDEVEESSEGYGSSHEIRKKKKVPTATLR